MARPTKRGSVSHIISFNFDDLIETYMKSYGIAVRTTPAVPAWDSNLYDVNILHPHGLLPLDKTEPVTPIVFTKLDFHRVVGNLANQWRRAMGTILSSNTCLFLGLSGADDNLMSLANETKDVHVSTLRSDCYWGVRISANPSDPAKAKWEQRGISQYTLPSHNDLPGFLNDLCRRAMSRSLKGS
jgi:hypothetical protein